MSNPFLLAVHPDGTVERSGEIALCFHATGGAAAWVWTSREPTIPAFWPALFAASEIRAGTLCVSYTNALEALERRRATWKAKASPLVTRGYEAFVGWVREHEADAIVLDLASVADERRGPLVRAMGQLLAFLDDEAQEPGPLLAGWQEAVGWKARKGQLRLETFYRDAGWPGDMPLFGAGPLHVMAATTGEPPFRQGPWPERRFLAKETDAVPAPLREAIQARAAEALEVSKLCPVPAAKKLEAKTFGNLAVVTETRAQWNAFVERANRYADGAAAFGAAHHVLDEGPLWRERVRQTEALLGELDRVEAEIAAVMRKYGDRE
jgi:hypothetical protein